MIRVRYIDQLSAGLNGTAERSGRSTIVYLLPGLTGRQRKAAIRRLRQEASRGCGPALPGADLTVALAADRCRVGLRNATAVIRQHPAASLLPTTAAALLMALFVLASVSARMAPAPPAPRVLIPGAGPVRVVSAPTLARMVPVADDESGGDMAGARVQPALPRAQMAQSGTGQRRSTGDKNKVCGPPQDRASSAERAPGTGCKRAPLLPPPPPPGGWPRFWPIERSAP